MDSMATNMPMKLLWIGSFSTLKMLPAALQSIATFGHNIAENHLFTFQKYIIPFRKDYCLSNSSSNLISHFFVIRYSTKKTRASFLKRGVIWQNAVFKTWKRCVFQENTALNAAFIRRMISLTILPATNLEVVCKRNLWVLTQ